jgi:heptosyltransferase-1
VPRLCATGKTGKGKLISSDPKQILIIKPSAIGDVVHTLPILNLLRRRFPDSRISWLLTPLCAQLLQGHPQLDEIILFERHRYAHGWRDPSALGELRDLMRTLRDRKFDLVIDLQGLLRSGLLTYQTRAPIRVGFANAREFAWLAYNHRVKVKSMEQHAIERYLLVAKSLGCDTGPVEYVFATDESDRKFAADLVGNLDRFALLFPGSNWETKRWPVENFAALVKPLEERFGLKCFVSGSPDEFELCQNVKGAINLAGKTNLRQLTALIERASLVITNDSGPMHLAAALNKPMVALFGPTNPIRTGPYGSMDSILRIDIPCSPCYSRKCSHQSCLRWLQVESVMKQIEMLINGQLSDGGRDLNHSSTGFKLPIS